MVAEMDHQALERAAWLIARRLRQWRDESGELGVPSARQVDVLRRLLEESGIRCDDSARMEDVAAFLIASPRGIEMVLSSDLPEGERLLVYARLLAHILIKGRPGAFWTRFEYHAGRGPSSLSRRERREQKVAMSLARAILSGRLEGAPRYLYGPRALPSASDGMRRALLTALHHTSVALYWRLSTYQHLRGLPAVTGLFTRVQSLLGEAEPRAA